MQSSRPFAGQHVAITGGTGAFGVAFARYLLEFCDPARVILYSRDETKHAAAIQALNDPRVRSFIGCVREPYRLRRAFHGVGIVVHAAAMKRVPECESNPHEAVNTNIMGTVNVANAAIDAGVRVVIGLSTDKAAAPVNLYGATKLTAEKLLIGSNAYAPGRTRIACTRYGNVLGSTGSVIPVWRKQAVDGVLTVTDERMTRFAMTMQEAVDLVALAVARCQGGEVFIPRLRGFRLTDLAAALHPDALYRVTGIRPGEKLHESLCAPDDLSELHDAGDVYVLYPRETPWRDAPLEREGVPVLDSFTATSDAVEQLDVAALRGLAA